MLMTKYTYAVYKGADGYLHTVVIRLSDNERKYFFQCNANVEGMKSFMNSMTDELTEGYFPKPGKKSSGVDNWAVRGFSLDRLAAEALAGVQAAIELKYQAALKELARA